MRSTSSFPTTHWSQVARAGSDSTQSQRASLEQLLRLYLPAFRAHVIRVLGVPRHDADDVVQGFVCDRIVAEGLIAGADQKRGRFRTYLLTALDRHVARVRRYDFARKRRPDSGMTSLENAPELAPADGPSAAEAFDIEWARAAIAQAIDLMRKECDGGRADIWAVFQARVLAPTLDGAEPTAYSQLVEELKLVSVDVAANLTVTGKRMFGRCLRIVIGQYVEAAEELEQEIRELREVLAMGKS
jgi:DNA-directed RNA polymerase specialized sigma24 family protein